MSWFQSVFGKQKPWEDQCAENVYGALVDGGGPGSDKFSAVDLGIKVGDLEKFSSKERLRLEMFCFIGLNVVAAKSGGKFEKVPFAFGNLLNEKWKGRGINLPDEQYGVAEKCFADYQLFAEAPVKWCGEWLYEFYETDEEIKSNRILFADHCLKQAQAMQVTLQGLIL